MTRSAELQTSAFLKDNTSDWRIPKLPGFGKGRQYYVFWDVFKGSGTYQQKSAIIPNLYTFK